MGEAQQAMPKSPTLRLHSLAAPVLHRSSTFCQPAACPKRRQAPLVLATRPCTSLANHLRLQPSHNSAIMPVPLSVRPMHSPARCRRRRRLPRSSSLAACWSITQVTNPQGKGLAAQVAQELPTSGGFFSGLGAAAQQQQQQQAGTRGGAAPAAVQQAQQPVAAQQAEADEPAVATHGLTFSYPDIGESTGLCGAAAAATASTRLPLAASNRLHSAVATLAPLPAPQTAARCPTARRWCGT